MEAKNGRMRNGEAGRAAAETRVIGIGGAGWHMLRALMPRAIPGMSLAEMNTDLRDVDALEGVGRYQIGGKLTRGLGAGGDPEIGARAASESAAVVSEAVGDCAAAVLLMGLGGGTATGAAPMVAAEARRRGARVVALCAMPFDFEGRRRRAQADQGLEALRGQCDAVFCFENELLAEALPEDAGVEEAFGLCSEMLARMAVGLHRALACRGIMDVDPADLARVLGAEGCRVAWGEGAGEQRVTEALDGLLGGPLMPETGSARAWDIVAQVTGGPEMSLADIQKITKRVRRECGEEISLALGATVDPGMRGKIDILLCAAPATGAGAASARAEGAGRAVEADEAQPKRNGSRVPRVPQAKPERQSAPPPPPPPPPAEVKPAAESGGREEIVANGESGEALGPWDAGQADEGELDPGPEEVLAEQEVGEAADEAPESCPPEPGVEDGEPPIFRLEEDDGENPEDLRFGGPDGRRNGMVQSAFNFNAPNRGRFDKTEVTMYKGEDLDIPTFMRRRMRITTVEE